MLIDAILSPAEIALLPQRELGRSTCVVFDVLRATSSMITALAHGAAGIYPVCTIDEAFDRKRTLPEALLGGERQGERIEGFDLGNSPLEYQESVAGRTIITTTTNGTVALHACQNAQRVLVAAMLNLDSIAEELLRSGAEHVVIVCAGTFAEFALEDACAAGLLVDALGDAETTDAAKAVLAVARLHPDPLEVLRQARNGRALAAKGRSAEVEWCAQRSRFNIVAAMDRGLIRLQPITS